MNEQEYNIYCTEKDYKGGFLFKCGEGCVHNPTVYYPYYTKNGKKLAVLSIEKLQNDINFYDFKCVYVDEDGKEKTGKFKHDDITFEKKKPR